MKHHLLPCALLLLLTSAAPAAKIVLHGGDAERTNAIVIFDAPADVRGDLLLQGSDGSAVPLQVDAAGHAAFVVDRIGKGKTITYSLAPALPSFKTAGVFAKKDGAVLELRSAGGDRSQTIFDYQMEPGDVPADVLPIFKHGAHLHPVFSPSGKLVTGNHPSDHRWHRGIWMAWTDTDFEGRHPDFWNMGKGAGPDKSGGELTGEVRFASLEKSWSGPVQGGFVSKHRFIDHTSGAEKDVLNETWEVAAYSTLGHARPLFLIDLISTQTCAGQEPLKLPKYHYGGLGVRGNQLWNPVDNVTMLTSNGDDRIKGDATKGKWVYLGGEVDGQPTGLAVLIHPGNFRFPQPLRLNPKNPQLCIAPSQDGDWSIEPGQPYVSRYRLVISDGPADAALLESLWNDYAQPLQVTAQ
jgi:hypothetical protein